MIFTRTAELVHKNVWCTAAASVAQLSVYRHVLHIQAKHFAKWWFENSTVKSVVASSAIRLGLPAI